MNGIYIPGLNMPNSCVECLINYYFCHMDYKYFLAHQELYDQRSPNCPLVPVPPHGDLIDRDKLEKDIDKYIGGEESRSRFHHWVQVQRTVIPESEEAHT